MPGEPSYHFIPCSCSLSSITIALTAIMNPVLCAQAASHPFSSFLLFSFPRSSPLPNVKAFCSSHLIGLYPGKIMLSSSPVPHSPLVYVSGVLRKKVMCLCECMKNLCFQFLSYCFSSLSFCRYGHDYRKCVFSASICTQYRILSKSLLQRFSCPIPPKPKTVHLLIRVGNRE